MSLTIRRPDDWHVHLRDGAMLASVVAHTARFFARAIVMPNLSPPVTRAAEAEAYRTRILAVLPKDSGFTPLMTCYLTDTTDAADLADGHRRGIFTAAKLYPAHATTNAAHGVSDIRKLDRVLATMEGIGMPLLIHGEVTDPGVDVFDREAAFIDRVLLGLLARHPALKVVFEHITTEEAVNLVLAAGGNLAATITPHHLMINRNAMFQGGIRPHFYCLPVAKRERHRQALRRAATSGVTRFFLGTDSAPHALETKEAACGCAGIFNAPTALACYAQVFEEEGALEHFEAFASLNGPRFYGLAPNEARVRLERVGEDVPARLPAAGSAVVPFLAGERTRWRLVQP